jgi:hypothetical protein
MPTPYRRAPTDVRPDELKTAARWDDRILGIVMVLLGAPRVVVGLVSHETFGAEATVASIVASLGLLLLFTTRRH